MVDSSYPIISLGNQTSIGVEGAQIILIKPSYLKNLFEKVGERSEGEYYHDLLYSSFSTFDQVRNYECARDFKSGWWFPYGIKYDKDTGITSEECQYNNKSKSLSNLNGMFYGKTANNQRQLVVCMKARIEDCIQYENGYNWIKDWKLVNTKTIKLSETKMWLSRPQSKLGYEVSVSRKEPILANAGKDCYEKCSRKQGRCKWCGKEGMCCSQSAYGTDEWGDVKEVGFKNGCDGTFGGKTRHECVLISGNLFLIIP